MKKLIEKWQKWSKRRNPVLNRPSYTVKSFTKGKSEAFIGVRRSGKTYIALQNAYQHSDKILYMNFEDPFFTDNNEVKVLDDLIENYVSIYEHEPEILVFDEIYQIKFWERWIRTHTDINDYRIIVTGSSAKLLSSELASSLTGRCFERTVWPLSFSEYLLFKGLNRKKLSDNEILARLDRYFVQGGFPNVVLENDATMQQELLVQSLNDTIYKDIVQRFEIRNITALNTILKFYVTNISSPHSFNSVRKAFNVNLDTVQEYSSHFESAFMLFFVNKYDLNLKDQARAPKKVYCIDPGLRQTLSLSQDYGKVAENIVYLELRRRNHEIYYHKGDYEVDFLIVKGLKPTTIIEVCYSDLTDPKTYERETKSVLEAMKSYKLKEATILTKNLDEVRTINGKKVIFQPLYKFLLTTLS